MMLSTKEWGYITFAIALYWQKYQKKSFLDFANAGPITKDRFIFMNKSKLARELQY